jgi:hypothetical protein
MSSAPVTESRKADQLAAERRRDAARRLRKHREELLDYDPSDMPSLSARRALAKMHRGGGYTTQEVRDFSQSDRPADILKQLLARKLVKTTGTGEDKRWSLTVAGLQRADTLRAAGFNDFRPPKPASRLSPEDGNQAPSRKSRRGEPVPVLSRVALRLFLEGAPANKYLTPTQQRLLLAVASEPGGLIEEKPNQRTADALVRYGLAERTSAGFVITNAGYAAVTQLGGLPEPAL